MSGLVSVGEGGLDKDVKENMAPCHLCRDNYDCTPQF